MNPDVFITIVFVGIAVLAAVGGLVFVVSKARGERVELRNVGPATYTPRASGKVFSDRQTECERIEGDDAAVH